MPDQITNRLAELSAQPLLPESHVRFLYDLRDQGVQPKVIYDVGACVLHWYSQAVQVWPHASYYVFEAMHSVEFLYKQHGLNYHLGVLSNSDRRTVTFWQNDQHPGGNSYYKENEAHNPQVHEYFNAQHRRLMCTQTLDRVVTSRGWPPPDLIKMDVQGAEADVLQGMCQLLPHVQHVILELQHVEYNQGAPQAPEVITWLAQQGFTCEAPLFTNNGVDGDYYFRRSS
jgi:FkbM family methyltransferase